MVETTIAPFRAAASSSLTDCILTPATRLSQRFTGIRILNAGLLLTASAIAGALNAQKLVFMTDVEGILRDKDNPKSIIRKMNSREAVELIADGTIKGGMIPKVECCLDAIKKGVKSVHVLDGRLPHSILLEIFTAEGIGTMVTPEVVNE